MTTRDKHDTADVCKYKRMRAAAEAAIRNADAETVQILVTRTQGGEITVFPNDLSAERENRFLSAQKEPLSAVLCVWANGQIDLPDLRVRKGLIGLDPRNAEAAVFLVGDSGVGIRTLHQTF